MFNRLRFFFWRYLLRFVLFDQVAELVFPVFFTLWVTLLVEYAAKSIPSLEHYAIWITLLCSVVILFLVLWLQHLLLAHIFRGGFSSLMRTTKRCHPVTRRFGANLLRRFLSESGARGLLVGVDSLPTLLIDVGRPCGRQLSGAAYAMLLREAAEMAPHRLWATWDMALFPIEDVIDAKGLIQPDYTELFSSLGKLYQKIAREENKCRVFVFDDSQHQKAVASDTIRWNALLECHRSWGFKQVYMCNLDVVHAAQTCHVSATLEDFVIYALSSWPVKDAWVIGRDRETRLTRLLDEEVVIEDTIGLYESLRRDSALLTL